MLSKNIYVKNTVIEKEKTLVPLVTMVIILFITDELHPGN